MLKISSFLSPKRLGIVKAQTKMSAIQKTLELFRGCPYIIDFDTFCEEIFKREAVLSTGLGLGIGLPHVRSATVREPVAALTVLEEPVEYGSPDNQPVSLILAVGMPTGTQELYLQYLSKVSYCFANEEFRNSIKSCRKWDDLCRNISRA